MKKTKTKEIPKQPTCEERVDEHLSSRLAAIKAMWDAEQDGLEDGDPEYGPLHEYGLSFDYVAPGTWKDQDEGYWRYQLSWGGPSDEFRFYASSPKDKCYKIEYWFLDWGDGAKRHVKGNKLIEDLWAWFQDADLPRSTMEEANGRED